MVFCVDFLGVSMYLAQLKECDAAMKTTDLWNKKNGWFSTSVTLRNFQPSILCVRFCAHFVN